MGKIADMMLDGTMCAGCGMYLHDGEDGEGYPSYCESCAPEFDAGIPFQGKVAKNYSLSKMPKEIWREVFP